MEQRPVRVSGSGSALFSSRGAARTRWHKEISIPEDKRDAATGPTEFHMSEAQGGPCREPHWGRRSGKAGGEWK